ncbi:MAG: hypothetical protein RL490_979 [Pseudomonadota bacterium]
MVGTMGSGWRLPYRTLLTAIAATNRIAAAGKGDLSAALLFGVLNAAALAD